MKEASLGATLRRVTTGARWRLFLVRNHSALKHRVHAHFGRKGRELLAGLDFPDPWRSGVLACVR